MAALEASVEQKADPNRIYDVIVVGAGPAGLTAALYLARFCRSVLVLHDGESRTLRIPKTHNAPAYPEGITGADLIQRMSEHPLRYGAVIEQAEVRAAVRSAEAFLLTDAQERVWRSRALILATGVRMNEVEMPRELHEAAIGAGVLRYCPICDGYEHIGDKIGVIGCDSNGAAEALFLRRYSSDVTLMPLCHPELTAEQQAELADAEITVVQGALRELSPKEDRMDVFLEGRDAAMSFDVVYPALGCRPRTKLAAGLGIEIDEKKQLAGDAMNGTEIAGLFAAGDVLNGLDQISVAIGHGAVAATHAHNWLRACDQQTLQAKT